MGQFCDARAAAKAGNGGVAAAHVAGLGDAVLDMPFLVVCKLGPRLLQVSLHEGVFETLWLLQLTRINRINMGIGAV